MYFVSDIFNICSFIGNKLYKILLFLYENNDVMSDLVVCRKNLSRNFIFFCLLDGCVCFFVCCKFVCLVVVVDIVFFCVEFF